jgi:hypothetical protein
MLESLEGTVRELDVDGWRPSPSGGGMVVVQHEEVHHCLVVVSVSARRPGYASLREAVAVAHFSSPAQTVFGYPNEEAYWRDPRGIEHGFYEVLDSPWAANLRRYDRATHARWRSSGDPGAEQPAEWPSGALRHFFIGSKDASFQALAADIDVTVDETRPFDEIASEAFARIRGWNRKIVEEMLRRNPELRPNRGE